MDRNQELCRRDLWAWAPAGREPTPSPQADTLKELLGEGERGLGGSSWEETSTKTKAGLGDVRPLLACASTEAQAVAGCHPFSTLDTF